MRKEGKSQRIEIIFKEGASKSQGSNAKVFQRIKIGETHPSGNGLVGISTTSLPNSAISVWNPFARFISATCKVELNWSRSLVVSSFAKQYAKIYSLAVSIYLLTVTLYFTARPASVSLFLTCK